MGLQPNKRKHYNQLKKDKKRKDMKKKNLPEYLSSFGPNVVCLQLVEVVSHTSSRFAT